MRESRLWNVSPTLPARHSPRITRSRSPDLAHPSLPVAGRQCPPPRRVSLFSSSPPSALARCRPALLKQFSDTWTKQRMAKPHRHPRPGPLHPHPAGSAPTSRPALPPLPVPIRALKERRGAGGPPPLPPSHWRSAVAAFPQGPGPQRRRSQGRRREKEEKPEGTGTRRQRWRGGPVVSAPGGASTARTPRERDVPSPLRFPRSRGESGGAGEQGAVRGYTCAPRSLPGPRACHGRDRVR